MKNIENFAEELKKAIISEMGEPVRENTVVKMNDQVLHGLSVGSGECVPTVYAENYYRDYVNGVSLEMIAKSIAYGISNETDQPTITAEMDLSFENIRDKLKIRLLNKEKNKRFLENIPYVSVGEDLAIIVDIMHNDWRAVLTEDLLKNCGEDKDTVFMEAVNNSPRICPPVMMSMEDFFGNNILEQENVIRESKMFFLTNDMSNMGAAALFYPGIQEKIGTLLDSDYYVLPSSVHEVIIVPMGVCEPHELKQMVLSANDTVVEPQDYLSDSVYRYYRDSKTLKIEA